MDKVSLRKSKIFAVLDEAKENNQRMTAQLLAARVNMGKQTVLPFYREWQELEAIGSSEQIALSPDIEQVLKRCLAKEIFKINTSLLQLNDELYDEKLATQKARQQYEETKEVLEQQAETLKTKTDHIKHIEQQYAEKEKELAHVQQQVLMLKLEIEKEKERIQALALEKKEALNEQEKRLDRSHQQLLNHWISALDMEKQEKGKLTKQLQVAWEKTKKIEQTIAELRLQISAQEKQSEQLKMLLTVANDKINQLKPQKMRLNQLIDLIGMATRDNTDIEDKIKGLLNSESKNNIYRKQLNDLNIKCQALEKRESTFTQITEENRQLKIKVIELEYFLKGLTKNITKESEKAPPSKNHLTDSEK